MDNFDEDFDKYIKTLEARMYKGLGLVVIIAVAVILIMGVVS